MNNFLTCIIFCCQNQPFLAEKDVIGSFKRYFNKTYCERPSTKLFMTCNIKLLKPVLVQIVAQHSKRAF